MRRSIVTLLAVLSLAVSAPAGATPPSRSSGAPDDRPPPHADANGDGLSEALEHHLAGKRPGDRVDVVVTFDGPGNAASAQQRVGGFAVRREFRLIRGFAATMTVAQARALAGRAEVFRVEPDFQVTVVNDANNADFGTAAARDAFSVDGAGIEMCVVDTGVDPGHEQLDSKSPVAFYDAINGVSAAYDDHGHGTHVAATALGDGTGSSKAPAHAGVAPAATLSAAKVLDANGSGSSSQVVAGVEWCAKERPTADIISMSLGTASSSDGKDAISQAVNEAVTAHGKVVVVAAGNSGDAPYTVGSPAAAAEAITVAAAAEWSSATSSSANASRGVHLAPWSSRGPTADDRIKPDITAPGMSVTSAQHDTVSGYVTWSGTSMATPFVAGTVALILHAGGTTAIAKSILTSTAQNRGPAGQDNDWGFGLLDGYAAVAEAASGSGTTTFPAHTFLPGTVADHEVWSYRFDLTDASTPVAATVLIDGQWTCALLVDGACSTYSWDGPDLNVRLKDGSGTVVDQSTCPLDCHANSIGRQETIDFMPQATGTYTLEVHPYEGDPNDGRGGTFTVDLSHGPAGTDGGPPTAAFTSSCTELSCSFTDASADTSDGAHGSIVAWSWDFGDGATSAAQHPSHTYAAAGSYTVSLTVTDNDGATDSVSQPVIVEEAEGGITLSAAGSKVKGTKYVDLSWAHATSTKVDVYRDGTRVTTTANDGAHRDDAGKGGGTHTYRVCEAGSAVCSNETAVSF